MTLNLIDMLRESYMFIIEVKVIKAIHVHRWFFKGIVSKNNDI